MEQNPLTVFLNWRILESQIVGGQTKYTVTTWNPVSRC